MQRFSFTLLTMVVACGCAEDLRPATTTDAGNGPPPIDGSVSADGRYLVVDESAPGVRRAVINATRSDAWVYLDLDTGTETTTGWDLAFQRFKIQSNGGVSGTGGVTVAPLPGIAFEAVTAPPAMGWRSDLADGDDMNTDPDTAFNVGDGWYAYDGMFHTLAPRDITWVVRTTGGRACALRIDRYYDAAGTSGHITLRWRFVDGTATP